MKNTQLPEKTPAGSWTELNPQAVGIVSDLIAEDLKQIETIQIETILDQYHRQLH